MTANQISLKSMTKSVRTQAHKNKNSNNRDLKQSTGHRFGYQTAEFSGVFSQSSTEIGQQLSKHKPPLNFVSNHLRTVFSLEYELDKIKGV